MRVFPMFNTVTTEPYIAQPTTTPFRWGWDFNDWVPWMLHYPLRPHKQNHPMLKPKSTKPPSSLNESSTSANMFKIYCISLMPSTSNAMINMEFPTSFSWVIKFGCICKKKSLQDPIGNFVHSAIDLTPSPRLWVTMILSSTFPPSLACTQCLM